MSPGTDDGEPPLPPGPRSLPLVGNSLQWTRDPLGFPERCVETYGDVVRFRFRRQDAVIINHPEDIRYVLAENHGNYTKGEYFHSELELLGDGIFTAEGEQWRQQRQLIDPIFHPERIRTYADAMVEYTRWLADRWADGEPRDVDEELAELTFAIACQTLFSVDARGEAPRIAEAVSAVVEGFQRARSRTVRLPSWVPTRSNRAYRRAIETFESVVADVIREHREADDPPDDVVTRLIEVTDDDGVGMTDRQVRDEVLTLMIAGHETVSTATAYALYLVATHPEVEATLVEELDEVLGGEPPGVEDLAELTYTERVLKEAMRLYPPVYFQVREPKTDDVIRGYRVPAGALVVMNQWLVHRDERWWDDPETFRPERWTPEAERERPALAYFPFSGGPRRCIGDRFAMMEARLILAIMVQRYRFELAFEPPVELDPQLTLRPAEPIRLVPRPREST